MTNREKAVLPPLDALYWAMMLAATALGEKLGDLFSMTLRLDYGPAALMLLTVSIGAVAVELAIPRRSAPLYWLAIVLTSTAGTAMADFTTRTLGLGYGVGSALLLAILTAVAVAARRLAPSARLDGTMSRRAEALYWIAILVAGTLGTASGDFVANGTVLGFAGGTLLLAALLAALAGLALAAPRLRAPLYWAAILVANPLGATLGDELDKPDGLGLGIVTAVLILGCGFAAIVAFSMRRPAGAPRLETRPERSA